MERKLIEHVRTRAGFCCEYCHFPERLCGLNFQVDHIIARKHRGLTDEANLAWSCIYCNSYKGPNLSGIDPVSGRMVPLFNPRRDTWSAHFQWQDAMLSGVTPTGRATVDVLRMNEPSAVILRKLLIRAGAFQL